MLYLPYIHTFHLKDAVPLEHPLLSAPDSLKWEDIEFDTFQFFVNAFFCYLRFVAIFWCVKNGNKATVVALFQAKNLEDSLLLFRLAVSICFCLCARIAICGWLNTLQHKAASVSRLMFHNRATDNWNRWPSKLTLLLYTRIWMWVWPA